MGAAALRHVARVEDVNAYLEEYPPLKRLAMRAAKRFLGGTSLEECLETARSILADGMATTIDFMGESTRSIEIAADATREFLDLGGRIRAERMNSSISLDLSHVGLALDADLAVENASRIARAAADAGTEVMISAEGSERTGLVLSTYKVLAGRHPNVGITLQANLRRTGRDLEAARERPGKIRLVKGAFAEPSDIAWPRGAELDAAYAVLLKTLLRSGHPCSVATHDPALLDLAREQVRPAVGGGTVEFEMLYGVTPERLRVLRDEGHAVRVFVPYGEQWFLYVCHRLAEHPPGVYRALADIAMLPGLDGQE